MKVSVDRTLCAVSLCCVRKAPHVFGVDGDGEVGAIGPSGEVVDGEVEVPAELSEFVEDVAFDCPMTAIVLSEI
ncbi:ferredoxin [Mycobacterium koreense]|uniref:Uncharacterized protein n=1 Tax=Mycolicibacillus koreensis TaxID=1069220 RepID=A0A7I7SFU6_9MYCO|nr:ferredoxin [Mycolicibacillus koreensis]MCV7250088.1 ferredoxin [Mycolicibacillus koreensis]OSC26244.1 hypothetical protein B8W67_18555 [Mycolicibacillus koreensis]BBY55812.1 hypothetical protein MKOR_30630 [Mycolicibacillus koreensis]